MLVKTRGIVLNFIRFKETSIIARIYTEELGLQSYIINGLRNKGTATRIALFQPFTLLSLVAYDTRKGGINRLSEYRCEEHFHKIPYDIRKSSIVIFLSEVLSRSVQEEEPNPALFSFLHDSILGFDEMENNFENFHLLFLLQLSRYLGFGPSSGTEITEQVSTSIQKHSGSQIVSSQPPRTYDSYFDRLIKSDNEPLQINGRTRRDMLAILMVYYQLHVEKLGEIKSLRVLSEVLSD